MNKEFIKSYLKVIGEDNDNDIILKGMKFDNKFKGVTYHVILENLRYSSDPWKYKTFYCGWDYTLKSIDPKPDFDPNTDIEWIKSLEWRITALDPDDAIRSELKRWNYD